MTTQVGRRDLRQQGDVRALGARGRVLGRRLEVMAIPRFAQDFGGRVGLAAALSTAENSRATKSRRLSDTPSSTISGP
jgi:hypothetical protein